MMKLLFRLGASTVMREHCVMRDQESGMVFVYAGSVLEASSHPEADLAVASTKLVESGGKAYDASVSGGSIWKDVAAGLCACSYCEQARTELYAKDITSQTVEDPA